MSDPNSSSLRTPKRLLEEAKRHMQEDTERAALLYEQAVARARLYRDQETLADALNGMAKLAHKKGESNAAIFHLQEAREIRRLLGDVRGEAGLLSNIGSLYTDLGSFNTALDFLLQAETLAGQQGDVLSAGIATNLARVYDNLDEVQSAQDQYQKALKIVQEAGHRMGEAILSTNYGEFQLRRGNLPRAEELLGSALDITARKGMVAAEALRHLGVLYRQRENTDAALLAFHEAINLARSSGAIDSLIEVLISEAETHLGQGHLTLARDVLFEAEELARGSNRQRTLSRILQLTSQAMEQDGEVQAALHTAREAHQLEAQVLKAEAEQRTRQLATQHELERARTELDQQRHRYETERQAKEKMERESFERMKELERKALYDALTGLPNRLLLADRFRVALEHASKSGTRLALGVLDLNKFKGINDNLGHHVGDELLIEVARRLEPILRTEDTVARTGGDEFVFLIRSVADSSAVLAVARRIMQAFEPMFHLYQHHLHVSPSVGFAVFPEDALTYQDLFEKADKAMYEAKTRGSGFELHGMQSSDRLAPVTLESALHQALKNEELDIVYQRFTDPRGKPRGAEALLRWHHPMFGHISPLEFLPIAESTGLSVPIGAWVLNRACQDAAKWHGLILSVNVSAKQFSHPDFAATVQQALDKSGLNPALLELEIKEELLSRHGERAQSRLSALRDLGVRLIIDDFGEGFTSFSALKHHPVHGVKLDRNLIQDLNPEQPSSRDEALLTAVVRMAQALGLDVIAKGVETEHQWEVLTSLGVSAVQGFLFSRPEKAF
ncbi:EAL domain-containing protein [Deinococcus misasensis]|uniref:EAL domain-containing protein n=1 Tax=Deinococcus misasensis TaxID=392413 RepID=UPI00068DE1C0|nr:EAL domain-containing protein [Deinococcus misasensis]